MSVSGLYREVVLDHYRRPRNRGSLPACTHAADGVNPLCGDSLRIELRCEDGRIAEMRFSGEACALTTAAASMLSECVDGLDARGIAALQAPFARLVAGDIVEHTALGELNALAELKRYPARRKCALLPFETLRAALEGIAHVSTENP